MQVCTPACEASSCVWNHPSFLFYLNLQGKTFQSNPDLTDVASLASCLSFGHPSLCLLSLELDIYIDSRGLNSDPQCLLVSTLIAEPSPQLLSNFKTPQVSGCFTLDDSDS